MLYRNTIQISLLVIFYTQMLTKSEWVAVIVALVVVVALLGSRFITQTTNVPVTDQSTNIDTNIDTTNNMEQNTQNTSGLIVKDVVVGTGAEAKVGNLVSVQYTGKFADGKVFDSSIPRGEPIDFTLGTGQVIKGWDQGILGMKVGGKRTLTIPPALGYGVAGYPPVIPANSTLYFDVELVGVKAQ